jgi:hypothetical protein
MRLRFLLLTLVFLSISSFAPYQVTTPQQLAHAQIVEQVKLDHQTGDVITLERFFCYEPGYFQDLILAFRMRRTRRDTADYIAARLLSECFTQELEVQLETIVDQGLVGGMYMSVWRAQALVDREHGLVRTVYLMNHSQYEEEI